MQFKVVLNDNTLVKGLMDDHEIVQFDGVQFVEIAKDDRLIFMAPTHGVKYILFGEGIENAL